MFLDTSIIIEIFVQGKKHHQTFRHILDLIEKETGGGGDNSNYVSMVQLAEISDWCARNRISAKDGIEKVKRLAQIVPLDEDICEASGVIKSAKRDAGTNDFGLIDALILASARSMSQQLLTLDQHFDGEIDCIVLNQKRNAS